jgi:hypothetical protein
MIPVETVDITEYDQLISLTNQYLRTRRVRFAFHSLLELVLNCIRARPLLTRVYTIEPQGLILGLKDQSAR